MNELEIKFFEEYTIVEKICNDMYFSKSGVSDYIAHMEEVSYTDSARISNWNDNYKSLKHLRWLRNQIAHGGENYTVTELDLSNLKQFHQDILNSNDPLALVRKNAVEKNRMRINEQPINKTTQYQYQMPTQSNNDDHPSFWLALVGFLFPIIGLIIFLVLHSESPNKAKSAGKGALSSVIIRFVLVIIIYALGGLALFNTVNDTADSNASISDTIDNFSDDLESSLDASSNPEKYASVEIGKFTLEKDDYGINDSSLSLNVKNISDRKCSISVEIEAVEKDGSRIDTDLVMANELNPGQSMKLKAFEYISSDEAERYKNAEFKVLEISVSPS